MQGAEIIEHLLLFGLTRQEAIVYVCLITNRELTGYEAAKLTGISRSNVYNALAGLVEEGAAYVMEGSVSKYVPVDVTEFCANKIRKLGQDKKFLEENMPKTQELSDGYITVQGYQHILDKAFHMIQIAQQRLYLSADASFIEAMKEPLQEAISRGNKVVLISEKEFPGWCTECYIVPKAEGEIRLITDSSYVLTGEITGSGSDTCLFSGQKNFVAVLKEALRNKMKIMELEEEKSEQ